MRRHIFLITVLVASFYSLQCVSGNKYIEEKRNIPQTITAIEQTIVVEGLVEHGSKGNISIISNWQSKSRISYIVTGNYKTELEKAIGLIVVVKGNITEIKSPWLKKFNVTTIIKINTKEIQP